MIAILSFLLVITLLVAVHEWGHFWAARRIGVKVVRFSIGFGPVIYSCHDSLGTEYVLSLLPLGGYVKLYGEESDADASYSFSHKPVGKRIFVLAAGATANFIFAVLCYFLAFSIGINKSVPIIGKVTVGSKAELAQLQANDEIIEVGNQATVSWDQALMALVENFGKSDVMISVRQQGEVITKSIDLTGIEQRDILQGIGVRPKEPLPIVSELTKDTVLANVQKNDLIIAIDDLLNPSRREVIEYVQHNPQKKVTIKFKRDKEIISQAVQLGAKTNKNVSYGYVGLIFSVDADKELVRVVQYKPLPAIKEALVVTLDYIKVSLLILKKMLFGELSVKHLSGAVAMAQGAGISMQLGLSYFLSFLAIISVSLGVLNLLPIPMLDGGQILFCLMEAIQGKPVNANIQAIANWIGGAFILLVTLVALYNDIFLL